jgi:threonine/homoserine/homoserine lactone efflux protein
MPTFDTLLAFALASLLLSASPGPSNLYIMARSIDQGHRGGFAAAGGMAIGSLIYVLSTALGIAAIVKYSDLAFSLLKLTGGCYLIFLGMQYFRTTSTSTKLTHTNPSPLRLIFKQSVVVELTNPKTALFFLAFLPQFADANAGPLSPQLILLGMIYVVIALSCDLSVAILSGRLGHWLNQHPHLVRWQDRLSGSLLMSIGGFIGLQELSKS